VASAVRSVTAWPSRAPDVAAGYGRDRETAEAFIAELTPEGLKGSTHQGNVASAEDCRRTVGEVIEQHGRLDILVDNAGITIDKTVLKLPTKTGTR
jgi:3-oxoacyl-[acyl-carrier protein] reductase